MFSRLIEFMDSFLDMGIPGYDCAVYHKGKCVFRHMNGYSDIEKKIPVKGDELYNMYSCSKIITCTAALQLLEQGKFSLDDKLSKYMPEFETMYVKGKDGIRQAENSIKIKHLFCMSAGFSYDLESPQLIKLREDTEGRCQTREAMRYLAKEPLQFEPGSSWSYSLCHDVLAALVEVISGERFEEYTKAHIFDVLGMTNTSYLLPLEEIERVSAHYEYNRATGEITDRNKMPEYRLGLEYASGGAGCASTVNDFIKFIEALRGDGIILKKETIDLMTTDCLTDAQRSVYFKPEYGYGLGVRCPNGKNEKTDFGWDGAAGSYLGVDRVNDITLFYAQHMVEAPNQATRGKVMDIATEIIKANG